MRHCMIVQNYYPFAEVRVQRQVEALVDEGHSVVVICRQLASEPTCESLGSVTSNNSATNGAALRVDGGVVRAIL